MTGKEVRVLARQGPDERPLLWERSGISQVPEYQGGHSQPETCGLIAGAGNPSSTKPFCQVELSRMILKLEVATHDR